MVDVNDPRRWVFPPGVYLAAVLVGVLLHRWLPVGLLPAPVGRWIGAALIAAWALLVVLAMREFRRAGTTPAPTGEVTALVTRGPFRFSRNPMYLSWVLFQTGVALWLSNAWILLLLPAAVALIDRLVIAGEEAYLAQKYGAEYAGYAQRVRRWL